MLRAYWDAAKKTGNTEYPENTVYLVGLFSIAGNMLVVQYNDNRGKLNQTGTVYVQIAEDEPVRLRKFVSKRSLEFTESHNIAGQILESGLVYQFFEIPFTKAQIPGQ